MKTLFISYCWANKNAADRLCDYLKTVQVKLIFDVQDLKYKDSIPSFMQSVKDCDYCVLLVSDEYLRSLNCMTEAMNLFEHSEYLTKVLPIAVGNPNAFSPEHRIELVSHWDSRERELKQKSAHIDLTNLVGTGKELQRIRRITTRLSEFLLSLNDLKLEHFEELESNDFLALLDEIGLKPSGVEREFQRLKGVKSVEDRMVRIWELESKFNRIGLFWRALGNIAAEKGQHRLAVYYFTRGLSESGGDRYILVERGASLVITGEWKRAEEDCKDFLGNYGQHPLALEVLGLALSAQMKYEDAIEIFKRCKSSGHPNPIGIDVHVADALRSLKQVADAKELYERAIEIFPNWSQPQTSPTFQPLCNVSIQFGKS